MYILCNIFKISTSKENLKSKSYSYKVILVQVQVQIIYIEHLIRVIKCIQASLYTDGVHSNLGRS